MQKKVLVVPAGTEIAHEILESLRFSKFWGIYGGNSVRDHSEILLRERCLHVPFVTEANFVSAVQKLVDELAVDFVVPAHDEALFRLAGHLSGAVVVGPSRQLADILRSKAKTIAALEGIVPTPTIYATGEEEFPAFCKPDRGQGSRGVKVVRDLSELDAMRASGDEVIVQELLSGEEVTIDCFSDASTRVLFMGARARVRTTSGISVRSCVVENATFRVHAEKIAATLGISGAWFFQMKKDGAGTYKLLEVANRIAGSSGFQRMRGVNFMDAWLHQLSGQTIKFFDPIDLDFVYDRALYVKTHVRTKIDTIYVDFDDTLIFDKTQLNFRLVGLLYGAKFNKNLRTVLLTRHDGVVEEKLELFGLSKLFDDVIHLKDDQKKSTFVKGSKSLFIDDSHRERIDVVEKCGAVALGPESIELLEGLL